MKVTEMVMISLMCRYIRKENIKNEDNRDKVGVTLIEKKNVINEIKIIKIED